MGLNRGLGLIEKGTYTEYKRIIYRTLDNSKPKITFEKWGWWLNKESGFSFSFVKNVSLSMRWAQKRRGNTEFKETNCVLKHHSNKNHKKLKKVGN